MRNYLVVLVFSLCVISEGVCLGQNVVIKGKADTSYLSENHLIYAYLYEDYISFTEKELANNALDTKGNFKLNFMVSQPTYVYLMVGDAKAELVVEPNKTYDINFLPKDSGAIDMLGMAVPAEIEFNNADTLELNYLMADFSNRYEAFLEYHRPLITKKNPAIFGKIDTMRTLCRKKYSGYHSNYLNTYMEYTFASLEESINLKEKEKLFTLYIQHSPVLLENYEYMTFFNQFFEITSRYFMSAGKTQNEINSKQNFSSLLDYFKQSKLLANDTLCEAVLLKSLAEYYRYPEYKVNAVLAILDQATTQCKAEANRRAAQNLKKKLSVMNPGKPAPSLSFLDKDGKAVTLSDFKGKYIYLNFWATWCATCTQEMTLIPELKKTYAGKIVFISISVDKKQETMQNFLKKNPKWDWTFLFCDNYKKAKEEFHVLTVPTYYLIDPKGNVLKAPAGNPIESESSLMEIKKKK